MNNLTNSQQEAIDFYSDNVDQVKYFGLTHLADREERVLFNQGKKLIEEAVEEVKSGRQYLYYSNEERLFIASNYNKGQTRKQIVDGFVKLFGKTHTLSSIGQKVEMCKTADKNLPEYTKFVFLDEELINVLQSIDSDRYQLAWLCYNKGDTFPFFYA